MESYYRTFSSYLKERFGTKVHRVSLDAGFTCPNRDGTLGRSGCAYCAGAASWSPKGPGGVIADRERDRVPPLGEQVARGKEAARRRYGAVKFIAYFQAYSGTYAPVERLKTLYDSVLDGDGDFVALAVGTRPDCVDPPRLALLASYLERGLEVWVEYGLQTANDKTLALVGRGHTAAAFAGAVRGSRALGLKVCAHVIIGLPGEGRADFIGTADLLAVLGVEGVKLHNLNILAGTEMAGWYARGKAAPLGLGEYASFAVDFLERLPPETIVERLVTDSDPRLLVEPRWSLDKKAVLEAIRREFARRGTRQGSRAYGRRDGDRGFGPGNPLAGG